VNTTGSRPPQALTLTTLAGALLLVLSAQPVAAQTDAAKPGAGLERAQKAADAVFHWIKLNGEKGANRQNPPPAPPAPAPAPRKPVAAAPKPAPAAVQAHAPLAVAPPAPVPVAAASAAPEPERAPVQVAAAVPTAPPTVPLAAAAGAAEPPAPAEPEETPEVPLKLLAKVEPVIPRQLQQQSFRNGFAQVQFTVAPDGSVSRAQVIKTSHARLGTAAVDAVRQWRFAPIPQARDAAVEVAFSNVEE
jgi:TonB family protein